MQVRSLGLEDPLEEGMATHASVLALRISWTEEPCRQATVDRVTKSWTRQKQLHTHTHTHTQPLYLWHSGLVSLRYVGS